MIFSSIIFLFLTPGPVTGGDTGPIKTILISDTLKKDIMLLNSDMQPKISK